MLLKYSQAQKRFKTAGIGKPQRTTGGMVKLTSGLTTTASKAHRKVIKVASKRPATVHRIPIAKKREQIPLDPCDNSNDSGLGFDHHLDFHNPPHFHAAPHPALRFSEKEVVWPSEGSQVAKRQRLDIKLESDDANDNFTFPETLRRPPVSRTVCMPVRPRRVLPVTLTSQLTASSQNGLVQLLIACQPETQHRARYQTEGSRGAVKDRSGNGFPVVKLLGYDRPATLQVFIGTDQGRVAPHMFYQACRVSGKNSTPCVEKKIDGTIVIEVDIEPSKDMVVTCDCVGILKERNVDVEHRFPEEGSSRSKKKSTRCRMVFRTTITNLDGTQETLQVTSQPIVCTQPPGVPEICKKSLSSCSVHGGQELFVLGKNFLKDTRVVFQEGDPSNPTWSQSVQPDKEFLQQSHLVCVVPPYRTTDIAEPVILRLIIESSGKSSEPHTFTYLPDGLTLSPVVKQSSDNHRVLTQETIGTNPVVESGTSGVYCSPRASVPPLLLPTDTAAQFMATGTKTLSNENVPVHPVMMWDKHMEVMMPPPPAIPIPMANRHSSIQLIVPDPLSPENLKTEAPESLEEPKPFASVSDLSTTRPPSMDTFHRFVSNNSLPSINVGNYLSNIEGSSVYANKAMNAQLMHKVPHIMIRPTAPNLINKPVQSLESSNLLTTAETTANLTSRVPFESRNLPSNQSTSHAYQEGLSVIVSSSMIQKKLPSSDIVPNNVPGSHSVGMKILIPPILTKEEPTMTEKLDAFINSTADSHISPKPVSPTLSGNHINGESSDGSTSEANQINTLQETFSTEMRSPLAPINLSSSHQGSRSLDDESVCSLVRSPSSLNNTEINCTSQTSVNNQMMNQSLSCQAEVIHSPPQQQQLTSQPQSFPSGSVSLDEQMLTSQSVSSQMNHELNLLMQSQTVSSTNQSTSVLQSALDQVSSQLINSNKQLCLSDINNLTHGNSINQIQGLPNFQTSLEQHLSSQTMSSQINNCNLNNLVNSSPSSSRSEALNSLQISLTQHQNVTSALVNHRHPTNNHQSELKEVSLSSDQGFSNLQVTYEQHHLNSQLSHKSMEFQSDSLKLNNLAPKDLEVAERVNAQTSAEEALSNFKASLNHHLSPQMISSCHSNHESESRGLENLNCAVSTSTQVVMNQSQVFSNLQNTLEHLTTQTITSQQSLNSLPTNSITTSLDTSQAQVLSDIQMSLRQLNSQSLTSLQDLNPVTSGSVSLERSIDNPPIQVSTSEGSQVLSNFSPAIEQQLATSNILTTPHTNALEMQNSVQLNSIDVNLQPTSNLQTNLGNFSSNSSQNLLVESMAPSSYLSSNTSNPVMTSPTSCHNPSLALNHPKNGISQTSPEMILQSTAPLPQPSMDLHGSLPVESQNAAQFNSTSAVQMAAMNQFEQRSACHESNRSSTFTITTQTAGAEPQSSISTVRKSEKGIPMPVTTNEITEMSENDLLRFINPRCFDTV